MESGGGPLADEDVSTIQRGVVHLKPLPAPDQLVFEFPDGHCCVLTDDGTDLTVQTLHRLEERGWPVVVLRLPQEVVTRSQSLPEGTHQVQLSDLSEEQLQSCLAEISRQYGPVAGFIHLHPASNECQGEGIHFTTSAKQVLQEVFLAAKYLKDSLNKVAQHDRAVFMAVVHLDGELGLGSRNDFDPINGGLFGLVKSLNLEWEAVFCRALDLDPTMEAEQAANFIMTELLDPNRRIVEVGYSPNGRSTLALASVLV